MQVREEESANSTRETISRTAIGAGIVAASAGASTAPRGIRGASRRKRVCAHDAFQMTSFQRAQSLAVEVELPHFFLHRYLLSKGRLLALTPHRAGVFRRSRLRVDVPSLLNHRGQGALRRPTLLPMSGGPGAKRPVPSARWAGWAGPLAEYSVSPPSLRSISFIPNKCLATTLHLVIM